MPDIPLLPPIADQPLSVVLFAHNDGNHLEAVVAEWVTYLNGLNREYEIILVDDGSTDQTPRLLDKLRDRHGKLRVLRNPEHRGEAAALRTALASARHPLLFYTVCEPRYRPADLRRLLNEIDRVHLVSGYRGGRPVPRFWRWLGRLRRAAAWLLFGFADPPLPGWLGWKRHLGAVIARLLFGVRNHDVACPFRLIRRAVFAHIPLQADGVFGHVEILAKANFLGCLLGEDVPLGDRHRPVVPDESRRENLGRLFSDGYRVFSHPDFGPVNAPPLFPRAAVTA